MNEVNYQGILVRIDKKNPNIIENSSDNGTTWKTAYDKEDTFNSFKDLSVDGYRIYAYSNLGKIWSSNYGNSWHLA